MARRMTLEGAHVKVVAELMPYSGGLKRNIVQCLDDYGIPLKLSHTVIDIDGKERVKGVTLAQVDEKGKPIKGTEEYIPCDTLLLSVGLIPENELSRGLDIDMERVTSGPVVNESLADIQTAIGCRLRDFRMQQQVQRHRSVIQPDLRTSQRKCHLM